MNSREGKSMTYRNGGEGGILARSRLRSSAFSLTCANNRMNTGDSAVTPVLIPSTCSPVWAQVLSKTDTKDTKNPRTNDQMQSESTNYKPDYISFNSGKSGLYRFGSSVMRRSACAPGIL